VLELVLAKERVARLGRVGPAEGKAEEQDARVHGRSGMDVRSAEGSVCTGKMMRGAADASTTPVGGTVTGRDADPGQKADTLTIHLLRQQLYIEEQAHV
jgi:hypothetical protein